MKKKVLLAALTLAFCLTACGGKDETGAVDTVRESAVAENETANTFSGDWNAAEEAGYRPFWLKYGPQALEEKDLSDLVMFGCFTDGSPVSDILYHENFVSYCIGSNTTDDIKAYIEADTNTYNGYVEIKLYNAEERYVLVTLYNLSGEPRTLAQLMEENNYLVGDVNQVVECNYGDLALGLDYSNGINMDTYVALGDLLGRPDKIYEGMNIIGLTDRSDKEEEVFAETVQIGGGVIIYDMMYQMNQGKLFVGLCEANHFDDYYEDNFTHVLVEYCSSEELYIYLRDKTNSGAIVYENHEYTFE